MGVQTMVRREREGVGQEVYMDLLFRVSFMLHKATPCQQSLPCLIYLCNFWQSTPCILRWQRLHQSGSAGIKSKVSKALQTELAPDEHGQGMRSPFMSVQIFVCFCMGVRTSQRSSC